MEDWSRKSSWRPSHQLGGTPGDHPVPDSLSSGGQRPGDLNSDRRVNVTDTLLLVTRLTRPLQLPCMTAAANTQILDVNGDDGFDLTDAVHLLNFLFLGGSAPASGRECVRIESCPDACDS